LLEILEHKKGHLGQSRPSSSQKPPFPIVGLSRFVQGYLNINIKFFKNQEF